MMDGAGFKIARATPEFGDLRSPVMEFLGPMRVLGYLAFLPRQKITEDLCCPGKRKFEIFWSTWVCHWVKCSWKSYKNFVLDKKYLAGNSESSFWTTVLMVEKWTWSSPSLLWYYYLNIKVEVHDCENSVVPYSLAHVNIVVLYPKSIPNWQLIIGASIHTGAPVKVNLCATLAWRMCELSYYASQRKEQKFFSNSPFF